MFGHKLLFLVNDELLVCIWDLDGSNTVLLFRNNLLNFIFVGLFNICDKILLAVEVLLQWRELFKRGVPITIAIDSSINVWLRISQVQYKSLFSFYVF